MKNRSPRLPLFDHECTMMSEDRHRAFRRRGSTLPRICLDFQPIDVLDRPRFPEEIPVESGPDPSFGSRKTACRFQRSMLESGHPAWKNPSLARKSLDLPGTRLLILESCIEWLLGTPSKASFQGSGA